MVTLQTVFALNIVLYSILATCHLAINAYLFASTNLPPFLNNRQELKQRLYQRLLGVNEFGRSIRNPHWIVYPYIMVLAATIGATGWLFTYILFLLQCQSFTITRQSRHVCQLLACVTAFTKCVTEMCANFLSHLTLTYQQLTPLPQQCVTGVTAFQTLFTNKYYLKNKVVL